MIDLADDLRLFLGNLKPCPASLALLILDCDLLIAEGGRAVTTDPRWTASTL